MTAELAIMQQALNEVIQLVTSNTLPSVCWVSIRLKASTNKQTLAVIQLRNSRGFNRLCCQKNVPSFLCAQCEYNKPPSMTPSYSEYQTDTNTKPWREGWWIIKFNHLLFFAFFNKNTGSHHNLLFARLCLKNLNAKSSFVSLKQTDLFSFYQKPKCQTVTNCQLLAAILG